MNGRDWITSPVMAVAWAWVPMFLVSTVIADAFAGERERHTLETLLATRLPEHAILFGKMAAAIGYALGMCTVSLVLGLVAVNVAFPDGGLVLYSGRTVAGMIAAGLLGAVLVAALGSIISLRAATVKQAQQTLGGMIFVLFLVPAVGVKWLWKDRNIDVMERAAAAGYLGVAFVGLLVLADVALILFALSRFRRERILAL
jgi:ABC-2 type transport system permease protein